MSCLKLWNYTYIYTYRSSVPFPRRRCRPMSVRPSRHPSRCRRPSCLRPLSPRVPSLPKSSSVRPSAPSWSSVLCPSVLVRPVVVVHPLPVQPFVRLIITYLCGPVICSLSCPWWACVAFKHNKHLFIHSAYLHLAFS